MQQALDLSLKGKGFVNPNPLVGAVITRNGKVIGSGFHKVFGEAHAEINALENVQDNSHGATLYVTLEPCNHHGKTPPCTDRIIQEKISKVVIGVEDPNPHVKGKGIQRLRDAGIQVHCGVLTKEIARANEFFMKYVRQGIPFCAIKTAMTLDGKIATYSGDSKWISNEKSRAQVHELRHAYSSIMVGVNTVLKDDPELTDRSAHSVKKHPLRIVVDSHGRTPLDAKLLNTAEAQTVVAVTASAAADKLKAFEQKGASVIICPERDGKVNLTYLIVSLGKRGIDSILLEGGSQMNFSALQEGIVDKVYSFISPKMIGGAAATTPVGGAGFEKIQDAITLNIEKVSRFEQDLCIEAYITGK